MESLPQEIILNILSRLPVTSILQCNLVCRAWLNLAQNSLLASMHFPRPGENAPCLILHCDYPIQNQLYSLELWSHNGKNQRVNKICVPTLPEFDVVESCKGLLCLYDSSTRNKLYDYNPFTGDYMKRPISVHFNYLDLVFGFGYHSTDKRYKVVKIDYSTRLCHNGFGKSEVQIFTLGSSTWKSLGKIPHHFLQGSSQVLVNRRLHWCTWPSDHGPSRLLVSFDLEDEQFQVVPKPDCGGLVKCHFDLIVLGGCLSAAVHCNYGKLEIWVMKEYNVKGYWIKEFSIGNHLSRGLGLDVSQIFHGFEVLQ